MSDHIVPNALRQKLPSLSAVPTSTLAYLGDAYYELLLRSWLLSKRQAKSGLLHRLSTHYANASYQGGLARAWEESGLLSAEEHDWLLRGRNADPGTMAKHAKPMDYRWATGLETLVGYWYLEGKEDRAEALLVQAWEEEYAQQK